MPAWLPTAAIEDALLEVGGMDSLIRIRVAGAESCYRRALTLCGQECSLARHGVRRNLPVAALVELRDGSVQKVETRGIDFTAEFLDELAEAVLSVRSGSKRIFGPLKDWLAEVLSSRYPIEVRAMAPTDLEPQSWVLRPWIVACVASTSATASEVTVLEHLRRLEASLAVELDAFTCRLDQVALRISQVYPETHSGAAYNFLADPVHRRNRQQMGEKFPCWLPVVSPEIGPDWRSIRRANDEGGSSIDTAAYELGVQPSTVRVLASAPADLFIGQAEPGALVRLLDLLRPEARPRTPSAWLSLRQALRCAEESFGPSHLSLLTRAALRSALHGRRPLDPGAVPEGTAAALEELRHAIIVTSASRCRVAPRRAEQGAPSLAERTRLQSIDRWLVERYSTRDLLKLSARWREAWSEARNADAAAHEFAADAHRYWGLIPRAFHTQGLVISPLLTPQALRQVGTEQALCFGNTHFDAYDKACRQGQCYLLVLREDESGCFRSAARIVLTSNPGRVALCVAEHFGRENSDAGEVARGALRDLVRHAATPEVQEHLGLGLKLQRARRSHRPSELLNQVALRTRLATLEATLGETRLSEVMAFLVQATTAQKGTAR